MIKAFAHFDLIKSHRLKLPFQPQKNQGHRHFLEKLALYIHFESSTKK